MNRKQSPRITITNQSTLYFFVSPVCSRFGPKRCDTLQQVADYVSKINKAEPHCEVIVTAKVLLDYEVEL